MRLFAIVITCLVGVVCCLGQQAADLVILNGDVRTMAEKRPRAEAVAVTGNKISAVGSNAEIRKLGTDRTRIIDAKGNLVLPGFNDSHVHFMAIGNKFSSLDLRNISHAEALYERLRHFSRYLPKGRWIVGSGGSDQLWQQIDAKRIDQETQSNPLFLYNTDAKSALTNTAAIRQTANAKADAGLVTEVAFQLIRRAIPQDHARRWAELAETASNYATSYGITSVQDTDSDDHAELYRELVTQGRLNVRIYDCLGLSNWKKYADVGLKAAAGTAMVRTGCLKGTAEVDDERKWELIRDVIAADKAGFQVLLHAIGQRQVKIAVDVFEAAIKANGSRDRRFRIEHAERAAPEDILRMAKLSIIASVQPHLFGRVSEDYQPLRSAKIRLAFGSDAPMTAIDPLLSVSGTGNGAMGSESLWHYTFGSAYAEFQEGSKGSIEAGKLADIVVIRTASAARPEPTRSALFTIVDGRVVYQED